MKCRRMTVAALAAATVLALSTAMSAQAGAGGSFDAATQRAMSDRNGKTRSPRGQWVYRIVERWAPHVQETYGTPMRRWAEAMAPQFSGASLQQLQRAAEARGFQAMNDALLSGGGLRGTATNSAARASAPAAGRAAAPVTGKALGDIDKDLVYVPVTPCRILDTRIAGGPIAANSFRDFDLTDVVRFAGQGGDTSNCNVGDKGSFAAAALNITVVTPNMAGYITAFPYLASQPTAATINYVAGDIRNGLAIVRLDQTPATYEFSVYSFAQTHLVADVVGYFREPEATGLDCYNTAESQYSVVNSPLVVTVLGASCQSGFSAISGGCKSLNSAVALYMFGSYTENDRYACQVYSPGGTRLVGVYTRCCRTPGK